MNRLTGLLAGLIPFVILRLFLLMRIDNYIATWETVSSANIVISRLHSFKQLIFGSLHPLYRLSLKVFLLLSDNPLFFAPFFNFLISVLLAVIFYLYAYRYFGKANAFVSLVLFSFVPVLALQAVLSTEIALMQMLLMASLYYFRRYLDTKNTTMVMLFLLALNLGHLTRFESWLLVPIFMLFLIRNVKSSALTKTVISIGMVIVPIQAFLFKEPLREIREQTFDSLTDIARISESGYDIASGPAAAFDWFFVMAQSVGGLWLLLSCLGFLLAFLRKKEQFYSVALCFMLLVFCAKSIKGDVIPHPRYITTVVLLLIPYFYYFLENAFAFVSSRKAKIFLAALLTCVSCAIMFNRTIDVYGRPLFSLKEVLTVSSEYLERDLALCDTVREAVPAEANVFVDMDYFSKDYDNIIAYGIRESSNIMSFEGRFFLENEEESEAMRQFTKERIMTSLPVYILLSEKGMFEVLFGESASFLKGSKEVASYKGWRILYLE